MLLKIPFLYFVQHNQRAFEFPSQQNVTLCVVWWIFLVGSLFGLEEGLQIKIFSYVRKGRSNTWSEFEQRGRYTRSHATPLHAWYFTRCPVPAGVWCWMLCQPPCWCPPVPWRGGGVEGTWQVLCRCSWRVAVLRGKWGYLKISCIAKAAAVKVFCEWQVKRALWSTCETTLF